MGTCYIRKGEPFEIDGIRYAPERTCVNRVIEINKVTPVEFRTDNFICSECRDMFFADSEDINHPIDWAYCPSCGARVVNSDEGEDGDE